MQYVFSLLILVFAFFGFIHFVKSCVNNFKEYAEKLRCEKYGIIDTTDNEVDTENSDT